MNNTAQQSKKLNNRPIIAVIGCGNMAKAMLGGLVGTAMDDAYHFHCSDRSLEAASALAECFQSATAMANNAQAVMGANRVILSVKPQQARSVCEEIAAVLSPDCHIGSVMAGIVVKTLSQWCGISTISRIMPNTPALIGQGVSGIFHHSSVNAEGRDFVNKMTNNVGLSLTVDDEQKMHAVTAVSGSGPAYFFHFIHQMQNAAIQLGFSPEEATKLVNQTALGACQLVMESNDTALVLQQKVCSPGGTTERAIERFEQAGMCDIIDSGVRASYQRSLELSEL